MRSTSRAAQLLDTKAHRPSDQGGTRRASPAHLEQIGKSLRDKTTGLTKCISLRARYDSSKAGLTRSGHTKSRLLFFHSIDRKSTRLNSSHTVISYAVF